MNNRLFVKLFIKLLMSIIIANVLSFAFLKYGVNSKKNIQRVQINEIENALFRVKNVKSIVNNSYSITLFLEELDRTYEMYTNRVLVELGLRNEIFKILDLKFKSEIFIFKDESLIYNYSKGSLIYKFDKYTIDKYISKDSRFYFENKLNDHIFLGDSIKLLDGDYNFFVYFEPITKIEIDGIYVAIITSILFLFIYIMLSLSHIKYFKVILNEVKYMDRHIPVQGNDELSQIAYGINIIKDEIKKKIENEAKLEKSKQELIINISHDLRTPLTSIIGYLYLLKAKVDDDGREYIEVLEGQVNRLKILMDDLFEYVKLTDEKMPLNKNLVNFKDLIMQFAEENYYAIKERELNLELNICNEEIFFVA